tara:strand:- start:1690 stop:2049 length:360 start_codon:yes stop_codon:yes gene_type:complete
MRPCLENHYLIWRSEMQSLEKGCSGQDLKRWNDDERLAKLERSQKLIDKKIDELFEIIAPWQIWIDVITQLEKEDNVELYYRDAEQFYPSDGNVRDDREAVHEPVTASIKIADHREERD